MNTYPINSSINDQIQFQDIIFPSLNTKKQLSPKILEIIDTFNNILFDDHLILSHIQKVFLGTRLDYLHQLTNIYKSLHNSGQIGNFQTQSRYNKIDLLEFAVGSIENCLGDDYKIRKNKLTPRIPNGDLLLMDRIITISKERHKFIQGLNVVAEYDVPQDAWFYVENAYPYLPYSAMMEIALQPCGFLSAHLGTALIYPEQDYIFRNLDGMGELIKEIDVRGKVVTNRAFLISSIVSGKTIIQKFSFELSSNGIIFYSGNSTFGYFPPSSMETQLGIKDDQPRLNKMDIFKNSYPISELISNEYPDKPYYKISKGHLNLLDQISIQNGQGKYKKGLINAVKKIDLSQWFFKNHFFMDPVMPGSLGVEASIQALQIFAIHNNLGNHLNSPRFGLVVNQKLNWIYRGQITPENKEMEVDVHVVEIIDNGSWLQINGEAKVYVDNIYIYSINNIAIQILEG